MPRTSLIYIPHSNIRFQQPLDRANLREVNQMVMLVVVSYMKYLIYSGLNKIVHLHGDLRDTKQCPWTEFF